jgi:hypothetical protein
MVRTRPFTGNGESSPPVTKRALAGWTAEKVFTVSYVMSEEHVLLFYVVLLKELFRNYMAVNWSFWRIVPRAIQRAMLKKQKQIQPFHAFKASVLLALPPQL